MLKKPVVIGFIALLLCTSIQPVLATDVDFGPYMAGLQKRIKRNWWPPLGTEDRRVVVYFQVRRNGNLTLMRLDKSSESLSSDNAALVAVGAASPVRPLPSGSPDEVDIQFTFDYHKMSVGTAANQESKIAQTLKESGDQRKKLANLYRGLGNIYGTAHEKAKAEAAYGKAIELYDQIYGRGSEDYVDVMGSKARYLYLHGPESDFAAATKVLDEAQKVVDDSKHANASGDLDRVRAVLILEPRKDFAQAERYIKQAARKAKESNNLADYHEAQLGLADCLLLQGKVDDACGLLNARIMEAMAAGQPESDYVVNTARLLCYLYLRKKNDASAAMNLAESLYKRYKTGGEKDLMALQTLDLCKTIALDAKDTTKMAEYTKLVEELIAKGTTPRSAEPKSSAKKEDPTPESASGDTSSTPSLKSESASTSESASSSNGKWPAVAVLTPKTRGKGKLDAIACNNEGVKLLLSKKFAEASAKFREAMLIDPTYGLAVDNFAIAQNNWAVETTTEPEKAMRHLRESLYIRPSDKSTIANLQRMCDYKSPGVNHATLAVQCITSGDYIGAIVEYRLALGDAGANKSEIQAKIDGLTERARKQFSERTD